MVAFKDLKAPEKSGRVNVAFYVRVSSDKQAQKEDGSIDTQLDRLAALVEYKRSSGLDWFVAEKLVEGEKDGKRHGKSAKNMDRPAMRRLRELAKAGLVDVVVITKIDRISRSVIDFLLLIEELERYGVKLVSMRENIDLTTPGGRLTTTILVALAQHEREITSARVKEKVEWRAEKGLPLGPAPIGYRYRDKMFVIEESFATHVRTADALYLERQSGDAVVREFRERGYRTPGGSYYTKPMICRMLRNPVYAGKLEYEGKIHDAQWKPIRSWETHEKIQRLMDRNDRRKHSDRRQPRNYVYLVQGLLRCGACGRKMSPRPGVGRNHVPYHYYGCGTAEKTVGASCPKRYIPAEPLDRAVMEFMKQLHLKPERIAAIAKRENAFNSETVAKLRQDHERVREQLGSVKQKLSHLADVLAQGGLSALPTVREKLQSLESERTELEATEGRLKNELEAEETQEIVADDQVRTLGLFHELVSANEDRPEAIKALLPRFIDYVVWHSAEKGEGRIEVALFPQPVALAADLDFSGEADGGGRCFARESQMVDLKGFEPSTS